MADKQFYNNNKMPSNEFSEVGIGTFVGGSHLQDQYSPYQSGHYTVGNNTFPPLDTVAGQQPTPPVDMSTLTNSSAIASTSPKRCYPTPSASQFHNINADTTSPVKPPFYSGGAASVGSVYGPNSMAAPQTSSCANATSKLQKFDPYGYSRSPQHYQQNNFQQNRHHQQNFRQAGSFFDDHNLHNSPQHHQQQQIRVHPSLGGQQPLPQTAPPLGGAAAFPPRPQHQSSQPPFLPPQHQQAGGGGGPPFPQHHFGGNHQSQRQQQPHPPPFFPIGGGGVLPHNGGSRINAPMSSYESGGGEMQQHMPPHCFVFDDQQSQSGGGGPLTNGHLTMTPNNAINGGIEFGEEFGADGGINPAQYVLSVELLEKIQNSSKRKALFELQIGLEQIAYDMANLFDTWASVIKDRMAGTDPLPGPELNIAAAILVEMAVVLDDSQYNYSRLGQYLSRTIDGFAVGVLLPQVSAFITETNQFLSIQHQRNLVLFLAELYDKLEINKAKSSELAAHLFDQLRNLLKHGQNPFDDQTVNMMVKVLKLVGRFLENDRGPQAMIEFLSEFDQTVKATPQLSNSAKDKVQALMELRENKWGVVAEQNIGCMITSSSAVTIVEPPEGVLTEDECAFMEENLDTFEPANAFEEDNVEDDYEKFLQATAIRAAEKALEKVSIDEDDDNISSLSSPKFSTSK